MEIVCTSSGKKLQVPERYRGRRGKCPDCGASIVGCAWQCIDLHLFGPTRKLSTLRMVSPILYFPEERVVALYRKCLEINMELLNCALGVYQDTVAVVSERPTSGLDAIKFAGTLDYLSAVADKLDDKLAIEFGAKLYGRIRASA